VHQIIVGNDDSGQIPAVWNVTYQSILFHHPNYRHILWTDRTMSQFLFDNYRSFLPIFESYPFAIQRVDAFRYFALYHFGGIYADLDVGARRPFDALLQYDAFLPHTLPFGFNNDFIGSRPRHPLFRRIIAAMPAWNRYYLSPCK
jgi:mannosyltransferase OCH1-like enzyme